MRDVPFLGCLFLVGHKFFTAPGLHEFDNTSTVFCYEVKLLECEIVQCPAKKICCNFVIFAVISPTAGRMGNFNRQMTGAYRFDI